MYFIISNEAYNTIEKVVLLNRIFGTIFLLTLPVMLCFLCLRLSIYNEDEPKKVGIGFKIYFFIIFIIISIHVLYNVNLKHTQILLPQGYLIYLDYSPNKKNIIQVYSLTYAYLNYLYKGCRIDCIDMDTKERRSIYFNPKNNSPSIEWKNHNNVIINGKEINIKNGYYNDYDNN